MTHEHGRRLEHDGEERLELVEEAEDDRPPDLGRQRVAAVLLEAAEGLVFGQAPGRGLQTVEDLFCRETPDAVGEG